MRSQLGSSTTRTGGPVGNFFKKVFLVLLLLVLAVVAIAWFRTGAPTVEVESDRPGIGRKASPVTVRVNEAGRGSPPSGSRSSRRAASRW